MQSSNRLKPKWAKTLWRLGMAAFAVLCACALVGFQPPTPNPAPPITPYWIWADNNTQPNDTVFFRHRFRLPQKPLSARLLIVADDLFKAFLNESKEPIAQGADWTTVQEFDITKQLIAGTNLLAVEATNNEGSSGLLYKIIVTLPNNRTLVFISDHNVKVERRPPPVWTTLAFSAASWKEAKEIAPANSGIWGTLHAAPQPDPSRIVRLWNILPNTDPESNPYTATRQIGDRMLMSSSVASRNETRILESAGFTLFQTDSDHISTAQTSPKNWDWREPQAQHRAVSKMGLDWAYFSHFAFPPKWYRETVPFTRLECLEHQQPLAAFSPWEPKWEEFVDEGYTALAKAFQEHGKGAQTLSALYVGVHGDYGEVGFPFGGRTSVPAQREDWQKQFGDLHNHLGFWCHDPLARANFRETMLQKYGDLPKLNAAWKRSFAAPDQITYPPLPRAEARREWLDFIEWYKSGIAKALDTNLQAARKRFPNTLLTVPAGMADEDPRNGADNSHIPAIAAKHKAEVRSTHSAFKPFAENAATMFGRLGSACRFYKVPFWVEPQSGLTAEQEVGRLFEAISQGAKGVFDWAGNAVRHRDVYYRYGKRLRIEKPILDVALFYPAEAQRLRSDQGYHALFAQAAASLRDVANFDILDDRMVRDGALAQYRVLALWEGTLAEPEVLEKIKTWVNEGGTLLAYDFGKITTFEDDTTWFDTLFGYNQELPRAKVIERYTGETTPHYRLSVAAPEANDYLNGDWFETETKGEETYRWAGASASVLLPVNPDKTYSLVIRAKVPQEAADLRRRVLINGREIGSIVSTGDVTYRFAISPDTLQDMNLARLTLSSQTYQPLKMDPDSRDSRRLAMQVYSVQMLEQGARPLANPLPPTGSIKRELDLRQLNGNWARRFGKGLTIFFPAKRQLLRGYLEVIRRAAYNLSAIDPGRRDAILIDNAQDGVYATLFTDKILYYNSTSMAITKTVTIPASTFTAWRGEVTTPTETTWKLTLEPHSIAAIEFGQPSREMLFECEEFTELAGATPRNDPRCSPGTGASCIRLPAKSAISTRFRVDTPGQYAIFTRCVRNNLPEAVEILIDDQPITMMNTRAGQTTLAAIVSLTQGAHRLTLRSRDKRDVNADFALLTNDPNIAGYDFALRIPPVD